MDSFKKPNSFSRKKRIRKTAEFDRVYAGKNYLADKVLVINYLVNEVGFPRLGLSISRRVGNAVVRNRWKRRIREAFRLLYHELPAGIDFVVRPRQGAECDFRKIQQSMRGLVKRLEAKRQKNR